MMIKINIPCVIFARARHNPRRFLSLQIIQNAKTVQSIDVKTASYKYFDFNLKNHLFVLCSLGRDKMVNRIVCDWYNLQRSESSLDRRRFSCILLSLTSAFEGLPPYLYFSKEKSLYLIKGFEDLA